MGVDMEFGEVNRLAEMEDRRDGLAGGGTSNQSAVTAGEARGEAGECFFPQ